MPVWRERIEWVRVVDGIGVTIGAALTLTLYWWLSREQPEPKPQEPCATVYEIGAPCIIIPSQRG